MRPMVLLMVLFTATAGTAQQKAPSELADRYGLKVSAELFPQATPQEALKSIVKAIQNKQVNYLLAHLSDPAFVDAKVASYKDLFQGGERARTLLAFGRLVKETEEHFLDDPTILKELRRFALEGEWKTEDTTASATLKGIFGRSVFMKKLEDRWFMENRQK